MTDLSEAYTVVHDDLMQLAAKNDWAVACWWPNGGREGNHPTTPADAIKRVECVGRHHESRLASEERRQRGTHLTPGSVALRLAGDLIALSGPRKTVLDPCCGAGIFLVAAQLSHDHPIGLYGSDLNATALAWCWAGFALAMPDQTEPPKLHLTHGDGLLIELPPCEAVLTNPPFRTSMRRVSAEERERFTSYRQRWPLGTHGRSDLSMAFVDACISSLKPKGWFGAVLPESQLASQSGTRLRQSMSQQGSPRQLRHLGNDVFEDAVVRTCTLVWSQEHDPTSSFVATNGADRVTSSVHDLVAGDWAKHFVNPHHPPQLTPKYPTVALGDIVSIRRLFTDDFYFVGRSITEADERHTRRVITVAHVDPGHHFWGERTVRIAGKRWTKPVVDLQALTSEDPDRAQRLCDRWSRHRIALATRGAVIECCHLKGGEVAQVPLIELWTDEDTETISLIYAQLLSPAPTAWYLSHHAAMDQTGAGIDLRAAAIKVMPIIAPDRWPPSVRQRTLKAIERLGGSDHADRLLDVQRLVMSLYREPAVDALAWWWSRVPKRMAKPSNHPHL